MSSDNKSLRQQLLNIIDTRMSRAHPSRVEACHNLLMRIIDNILREPTEEKFQKIKMRGKTFSTTVEGVDGVVDYLRLCGFVVRVIDFEEHLVLNTSDETVLEKLQTGKDVLEERTNKIKERRARQEYLEQKEKEADKHYLESVR